MSSIPSSVLIIGSGVFGLSTAYALATRTDFKQTEITVLDRVDFPAPDASSVDTSRLVRDDYDDYAYATLAAEALEHWRGEFGDDGRYTESGYVLLLDADGDEKGHTMCKDMLANTQKLGLTQGRREDGAQVVVLRDSDDVKVATPGFDGLAGDSGYVNYTSGWADAENGLKYMRQKVEALGRVRFEVAEVESLIFDRRSAHERVIGVKLSNGDKRLADLTILAAGAWSGKFIDLRGISSATGQALAYVSISDEEQARLLKNPAILSLSNFMYIIQPRDNVLKIARHGYGYSNPQEIPHPEHLESGKKITVSLPRTKHDHAGLQIPAEAEAACRKYMAQCIPEFADRPWLHTRICWYHDTILGDWLIDNHPQYSGLFVATGGSGHGYKFLPVIGERIVDIILGKPRDELGATLQDKWRWPQRQAEHFLWTNEWRGGKKGMVLDEELAKKHDEPTI